MLKNINNINNTQNEISGHTTILSVEDINICGINAFFTKESLIRLAFINGAIHIPCRNLFVNFVLCTSLVPV